MHFAVLGETGRDLAGLWRDFGEPEVLLGLTWKDFGCTEILPNVSPSSVPSRKHRLALSNRETTRDYPGLGKIFDPLGET